MSAQTMITGRNKVPYKWQQNSRPQAYKPFAEVESKEDKKSTRIFAYILLTIAIVFGVLVGVSYVNRAKLENEIKDLDTSNTRYEEQVQAMQQQLDKASSRETICARAENELYMHRTTETAVVSLNIASETTANR